MDFLRSHGKDFDFETALNSERVRLVRLCARYTRGDLHAAEDLAQETLLAAWKSREQLSAPERLKPWLSAIARNVCIAWRRGRLSELAQQIDTRTAVDDGLEELLVDEQADLELILDHSDLATLLGQALGLLPAVTAQMLVDHYLNDISQAEIAARMGINPGTVGVRLQRGRSSIQRLLLTRLQRQAAGLGLVDQDRPDWEETNIWCLTCGQARLLGCYQKDRPDGVFALRCPRCHPEAGRITTGLDLSIAYNTRLLGGLQRFKPAYARLLTAVSSFFRQALVAQPVGLSQSQAVLASTCPACQKPVPVRVTYEENPLHRAREVCNFEAVCPHCGWRSNTTLWGLVLALPEAQLFWRENPRLSKLPVEEVEAQGVPAYLTRLQSVTDSAGLTVISHRDTFAPIEVFRNG